MWLGGGRPLGRVAILGTAAISFHPRMPIGMRGVLVQLTIAGQKHSPYWMCPHSGGERWLTQAKLLSYEKYIKTGFWNVFNEDAYCSIHYILNICSETNFRCCKHKNARITVSVYYIFNYEWHLQARRIANEKPQSLSSLQSCDWFPRWRTSCLHLDCLDRVLHSAGLISLGNYCSLPLPSCGFQSVKRQHVSRRSEEEVSETPVSGNNWSSFVRRPPQQATPPVHPSGSAIIFPGIHLSNLLTSSYLYLNSFSLHELCYLLLGKTWVALHPQPSSAHTRAIRWVTTEMHALRSSEYLSESTSKYALDEQFNGL